MALEGQPTTEPPPELAFAPGAELLRRLAPRLVLSVLLALIAILATAGGVATWMVIAQSSGSSTELPAGLVRWFHLSGENNVPTWFAATQLLIAAVLSLWIAETHRRCAMPFVWRWTLLSYCLAFVAVDEILELHEQLGQWVHDRFDTSGLLLFGWVLPYGIAAVVFALCYFRFWLELPGRVRRLFVVAAVFLVGGAIGFESLGGLVVTHHGFGLGLHVVSFLEECFEKLGAAILIYALLVYVQNLVGEDRRALAAPS